MEVERQMLLSDFVLTFIRLTNSTHDSIEKHREELKKHGEELDGTCPRCQDLTSRIHGNLPHSAYCQEIKTHINDPYTAGGFTASAKIVKALDWFKETVPKEDKAIFLSFFKGSLDLIEGILVEELGIECARYDGDVSKEVRNNDLERFKTSIACRVLLATVQSGGTGLNITEANHVCFLDRWFNPCVHDQAESRCHRIGQKKSVNIAYLDNNYTIDIVMKKINVLKEGNASVILADGTSLGDRWSLGYRNVSGAIGETLNALKELREEIKKENGDAPLPPYVEADLEAKMAQLAQSKLSPTSSEKKEDHDFGLKEGMEWMPMPSTSMHASTVPLQKSIRPNHSNMMNKNMTSIGNEKMPSHGSGIENASTNALPPYSYNGNKTPTQRSSMAGKRSASTSSMPVATSQAASKKSRFSHGLAAIVSRKKARNGLMRRKKRGDL